MSQGKSRVIYMGRSGQVQTQNSPDWSFLYNVSTTSDPEFHVGDRVVLPDGRVFRYAQAGTGGVRSEMGAAYQKKTNTCAVAPAQATLSEPGFPSRNLVACGKNGSLYVSVTIDTAVGHLATGVLAQDELRGGYIVIGNGGGQTPQNRGIIGHPALATAGGILTLKLDAALTADVTVGTTTIELIGNPYIDLVNDGSTQQPYVSWMGVPARTATVGQYFWLQTWGPCWITSDSNTCDSDGDREIFFKNNGSVQSGASFTYAGYAYQRAGFAIDKSGSGQSNAPMVMLQVSI